MRPSDDHLKGCEVNDGPTAVTSAGQVQTLTNGGYLDANFVSISHINVALHIAELYARTR
jgi:hypothetical protein